MVEYAPYPGAQARSGPAVKQAQMNNEPGPTLSLSRMAGPGTNPDETFKIREFDPPCESGHSQQTHKNNKNERIKKKGSSAFDEMTHLSLPPVSPINPASLLSNKNPKRIHFIPEMESGIVDTRRSEKQMESRCAKKHRSRHH